MPRRRATRQNNEGRATREELERNAAGEPRDLDTEPAVKTTEENDPHLVGNRNQMLRERMRVGEWLRGELERPDPTPEVLVAPEVEHVSPQRQERREAAEAAREAVEDADNA